jgi:hypothetical protein
MFRAGHGWKSVGSALGCSAAAAKRAFSRIGINTASEESRLRSVERVVSFKASPETWDSLNESASARGKGVGELLSDVAEMLADPVLLENVLDDGVSI